MHWVWLLIHPEEAMGRLIAAALTFATTVSCMGQLSAPSAAPPDTNGLDAGVACVELQGIVSTITKGTWCVVGDVIIPSGVTLDIPAGTTFIVKGRYHFGRDPAMPDLEPPAIEGSGGLRAIGTAEEPIIFRGETPDTAWYGIAISHAQDVVQLEHVTISDTLKDDRSRDSRIWRIGGALNSYVNKKGTVIRHCTFTNNRAWSASGAVEIFAHGQWPNEGPVEITDSRFENNSCDCALYSATMSDQCGGGALRLIRVSGDGALVKLENNVFRNNTANNTVGGVAAYGGALGGAQAGVILGPGNVFEGNRAANGDGAISCNHEPMLGRVIQAIDPSVTFTNNQPDTGCGR
jgi:hypothetical protein